MKQQKLPKSFPKFQTVEWWIEQLKEFDLKAVVIVAAGPGDIRAMASIYPADKPGVVYIDVE